MKPRGLLGFRARSRVGINIAMMLIVLVLITPLWYVINNAFKVEPEILRRPLLLLPSAATLDSVVRSFAAMKYPVTFMNSAIVLVLSCAFLISLGSLAAFGIAMANSRALNIVYIVLVAMITLPFQLAMVPLIFLLKSLHLVNTYGAFGSVGKHRHEVILEGTSDTSITAATLWRPYEFKCKPGDVYRRPCVVAPYQYRIDWQIWFAAMSTYQREPWLVHFVTKLLQGDPAALSLLATNPFPDAPPRFVRAELYEYEFTHFGDTSGAWWTRKRVGPYLPPLSLDSPGLRTFLHRHGWG